MACASICVIENVAWFTTQTKPSPRATSCGFAEAIGIVFTMCCVSGSTRMSDPVDVTSSALRFTKDRRLECRTRLIMAAPETLTLKTNRDRKNWWQSVWIRRALLLLPLAIVALGIADFFGQRPTTGAAQSPVARLSVTAPTRARSGLIYAARFRIEATADIKQATLILDPGWADGYTVNGEAPQPRTQGSADGRLNFGFGHIPAGRQLTFWLSLQVNPTTVGRHRQTVRLYDGKRLLLTVHRSVAIFP